MLSFRVKASQAYTLQRLSHEYLQNVLFHEHFFTGHILQKCGSFCLFSHLISQNQMFRL